MSPLELALSRAGRYVSEAYVRAESWDLSQLATLCEWLLTRQNVERLDITDLRVGFREVAELVSRLPTLKSLSLRCTVRYCCVRDPDVALVADAVAKHPSLRNLWIQGDGVADDGAEAVARAVARSSSLRRVAVESRSIDERGHRALFAAAAGSRTLESLGSRAVCSAATRAALARRPLLLRAGSYLSKDVRRKRMRMRASELALVLCSRGDEASLDVVRRLVGGRGRGRDGDDVLKRETRDMMFELMVLR